MHECGAQVGDLRGERRGTAAVLHPGAVETVVRSTKAAKQSHRRVELFGIFFAGQAEVMVVMARVVVVVVGVVVGEGGRKKGRSA